MAIKHKVLKDFQLLTDDKKILILKAKTIIEDYKFKNKLETVSVPVDIIKNNPDYFSFIDWKEELQSYLKVNKIPQPAVITKKLVPFIETMMEQGNSTIKEIVVEKEVFIENTKVITDDSLSIELETKIKKIKLKENQLDKEIEETNAKEIEATNREKRAQELEKTYTEKLKEVEDKESHLNSKQVELSEKELRLNEKESNLSSYVTRGQISQKIDEYAAKGFQMDFFRNILGEI
jgi:hypothetical protein